MVQEILFVSMKAGKKVIPRRYYLFPRNIWTFPGITGFTVQIVSAPGPGLPYQADVPWLPENFPLKRPKKSCSVYFFQLYFLYFYFLLMINNQHLHDFHGGLLWTLDVFMVFSHGSLFHEEVVIQAHLVFSWWKALSCVQKAQCDRILWLFRLLFALNLPSDLWM